MTTPQPTTRPRGAILVIGVLVLAVAIAGAAGLWYLFFRPAGPAPVSLASLPAVTATQPADSTASPATEPTAGAAATADPAASEDPAATAATSDGIAGAWAVDTSVGSGESGTFVGYRVNEQLATVGAATAVGRTTGVTGTMTIDGTTITAVDITADLTGLQSDESNRDRQLQRQGLETATFPTATFSLTQPIELESVPAEGEIIDVTATGDLTLHGVTKSVEIPLQARLENGVITVAGSLPIQFADYSIQQPQGMIVLSVEDHGILELQVHFTQS
ncbi:MAG TPA: YceI family protein [Candidatus Limnocylindrales bacterium]